MSKETPELCFVISPIGEEKSPERERADIVFDFIIKPAVEGCGYKAERADHISQPGVITTQIIDRVLTAPLVVADLTGRNPNVFYELAIRHMVKKPFVQLIHENETIPFDVAGNRTIKFDEHNPRSIEKAKAEIQCQVEHLKISPHDVQSPISMTIDLQGLRESKNAVEKSQAAILDQLSEIKLAVEVFAEEWREERDTPESVKAAMIAKGWK
jgi:hypothetical protein